MGVLMKLNFLLSRISQISIGFAACFVLLHSTSGAAALTTAIPAGFDTQAWMTWLETVVKTGEPTEMPNGIYLTKSHIEPSDTDHSHQADYFSTVGGFQPNGTFVVDHIETVSETWTISADGQRDVDQWLFMATREGDLSRTLHMHVVETADGQVLQDDVVPVTADEAMVRWVGQLNAWYAVTTGSTFAPPPIDAGATGAHAGLLFQLIH